MSGLNNRLIDTVIIQRVHIHIHIENKKTKRQIQLMIYIKQIKEEKEKREIMCYFKFLKRYCVCVHVN